MSLCDSFILFVFHNLVRHLCLECQTAGDLIFDRRSFPVRYICLPPTAQVEMAAGFPSWDAGVGQQPWQLSNWTAAVGNLGGG